MCCHLAPVTRPERVMKSGEATARQLSRSAQGRRAGPPLPSATRTLGEGPPGPWRAGRTFRAAGAPRNRGPWPSLASASARREALDPFLPALPPPTHTPC